MYGLSDLPANVVETKLEPGPTWATISWINPDGKMVWTDITISKPASTVPEILSALGAGGTGLSNIPWLYIGVAVVAGALLGHFLWK